MIIQLKDYADWVDIARNDLDEVVGCIYDEASICEYEVTISEVIPIFQQNLCERDGIAPIVKLFPGDL